jgi:hypothetical protein
MNNKDNLKPDYAKKMSEKYGLSEDSINKANELAKAIEILGENIGEDIKLLLINNEIDSQPEDIIELSQQIPDIQRSIYKMIKRGTINTLREGLEEYVTINDKPAEDVEE